MGKREEFLEIINKAINVSEEIYRSKESSEESWMAEDALGVIHQLEKIKEQISSGELSHSGGAGLGITRALSEWAPKELYDAGKNVEDYYKVYW